MEDDEVEWAPLSLTLVEYPKGDLLGKLLALISLAPFGIGAGFLALILFRRDLHTIAFFAGTLLNEALNVLLKHAIKEERPSPGSSLRRENLYGEYGMPSSHSQFMWFFTTYLAYFVFVRLHHINNNNNNSFMSRVWVAAALGAALTATGAVSVGRVYLMYHTVRQVAVGALVGSVTATVWFAITHCVLTPLFPQIVSWRVSELLLLRDTTLIPNVLWFEYTSSRQEARARSRKLVPMKAQ